VNTVTNPAPTTTDGARRSEALVQVRDLRTEIDTPRGLVTPVRGVSFDLKHGEMLGIVGETGSGKSLTVRSVMGLLPVGARYAPESRVDIDGVEITTAGPERLRGIWSRDIALIPQDPTTSLNPVRKIGAQIVDVVKRDPEVPKKGRRDRAAELLRSVGIADAGRRLDLYPHELSGGMRQRVLIAMAIALSPKLLIADEPTTALDVTVQRQILELIDDLRHRNDTSVILVSHDLSVIGQYSDRVAVMYGGRIVETMPAEGLHHVSRHPYTHGLLVSHPTIDAPPRVDLPTIGGEPPDIRNVPAGCPFAPRCERAESRCTDENPPLLPEEIDAPHRLACFSPVPQEIADLTNTVDAGGHR
jgi:peptide/nickel transport system ATP-binding protein